MGLYLRVALGVRKKPFVRPVTVLIRKNLNKLADKENMPLKKLNKFYISAREYILSHDLVLATCITILLITFGVLLAKHNNQVVGQSSFAAVEYSSVDHNPLSFMSNWDGPDYIGISKTGYASANQTNFFPLYPLLINLVNRVLDSRLYSALLIAWVSIIGAVYYYLRVVKLLFKTPSNKEAIKGLLLFIFFPTAVFLLATYTESIFAFLALGAIYYALKSKYLTAGLFALFATATHDNGVFVLILIFLILLEQKVGIKKAISSFCIGALGILSYMVFLSSKFHNPLEFIVAQKGHGWLSGNYLSDLSHTVDIFNLIFIALIVISVVYWWKRRKSFAVYSFLFLLIPLAGGQFGGFNRYVLMVFPIQLMLYQKYHDKTLAYPVLIILSCASWTYFLFQYAGGYIGG